MDVRELTKDKLTSNGPISHIIHLAAMTDAAGNLDNAKSLFNNNLESTMRIGNLARDLEIPLIFPSTTSVYGSQDKLVDEECEDLFPQSPYAECKLLEEKYLQESAKLGLRVAILRLGTIHGSSVGMRFHTAVNKFILQAKLNLTLTVWETALDQKRPYLSLSDGIQSFFHVIENNLFNCEIYNIVTRNRTVREIITCIESSLNNRCTIEFVKSPIMNQLSYEVSSKKFEKTGFHFLGNLESDVRNTLALLDGVN
jgi:nucleoside-diphosphate-sugar epimerase